jgi:hypothetical protein
MQPTRILVGITVVLLAAGCGGEGTGDNQPHGDSIGADENNRYELTFTGGVTMEHTGGLICKVEEGKLVMDFNIDATDGTYEYQATVDNFDPAEAEFYSSFGITSSGAPLGAGLLTLTFGYGPAPADFPGVVRAAGTIAGALQTPVEDASVAGSYACFLMDSEVGN